MIPAFPKIFTLGMKETERLFNGEVEVTEKIDGSQFSFGKIDGQLHMRSKGAIIYPESVQKMFQKAADFAQSVEHLLPDDTIFHGEYLDNPKHNTLAYGAVPTNNFALFAVRSLPDTFISNHDALLSWSTRLGCGVIPLIYRGHVHRNGIYDQVDEWINSESHLGGAKMEGVVLKNYSERVLIGGQVVPLLSAKYVSEQFKEKHRVSWPKNNPGNMERLAAAFRTEARWHKAIQHLRDNGELEDSPRDIGKLFAELNRDFEEECREEVKEALWKLFRKDIMRIITRGFPEWYKEQLVRNLQDAA